MDELWKSLPEIIKQAATNPLGILALMIIALAILAVFFFRGAAEKVRVVIFVMLFFGVVPFGAVVIKEAVKTPPDNKKGENAVKTPPPDNKEGVDDGNWQPRPLTLVANIWKVESGQKSTMLATKEFSSGVGRGVSPTSLKEFAKWISHELHLGGGQPAPVRIGVEQFAGPAKITERVCSELRLNPLIQIVDPEEQRENLRLHPTPKIGVRSPGIDYIISGSTKPKTP